MFHLIVEVKFPMGKAHVTDMTVTTKTSSGVLLHDTKRTQNNLQEKEYTMYL
jgi:hypothetical protein